MTLEKILYCLELAVIRREYARTRYHDTYAGKCVDNTRRLMQEIRRLDRNVDAFRRGIINKKTKARELKTEKLTTVSRSLAKWKLII